MKLLISIFWTIRRIYYRLDIEFQKLLLGRRVKLGSKTKIWAPVAFNGAGAVSIGSKVILGYVNGPKVGNGSILVQARKKDAQITMGNETSTSNNITIIACQSIVIGCNCQIGDNVTIYDSDFHHPNIYMRKVSEGAVTPVEIGNNVWIGSRVIILKGVSVGDGSVIAAGSVLTKSIPANCLAAGVPAKVIRNLL